MVLFVFGGLIWVIGCWGFLGVVITFELVALRFAQIGGGSCGFVCLWLVGGGYNWIL